MISETMRRPEVSKDYSKHKTLTSADITIQTMAYLKLGKSVVTVDHTANASYEPEPRQKLTNKENIERRKQEDWVRFHARQANN